MGLSNLQIGLILAGILAVVAVLIYNKWQERKFRREAESVFRSDHVDVLLEPSDRSADAPRERAERIEPTFDEPLAAGEDDDAGGPAFAEIGPPLVDEKVDGVFRLESAEPVSGASLLFAQQEVLGGGARRIRWYGWDEPAGGWHAMASEASRSCRHLRAALQLADRSGSVSGKDLEAVYGGMQRLADRFLAVAEMPDRKELAERAAGVDRFAAAVDVQIGINIVSRDSAGFPGTKLRGVAEASGMALAPDGTFGMADDAGDTLFSLSNLEPSAFSQDTMKALVTHGLTLTLDVPRVRDGAGAFDRMVEVARRFAEALDGVLVDDNRAPLTDKALDFIRSKIVEFQEQMRAHGVPAGEAAACRLFA